MTGYIEMALESAKTLFPEEKLSVKDFVIYEPLALRSGQSWILQLTATPSKSDVGEFSFEICSRLVTDDEDTAKQWKLHATGKIGSHDTTTSKRAPEPPTNAKEVQGNSFYASVAALGFSYGPNFSFLSTALVNEQTCIANLDQNTGDASKVIFYPGLFDSCLHAMLLYSTTNAPSETHIHLPLTFDNLVIHGKITSKLISQFLPTKAFTAQAETLSGNIIVFNDEGQCVAEIFGFNVKRTSKAELQANLQNAKQSHSDMFYSLDWQPSALADDSNLTFGNTLIFTENDALSQNIAGQIKNIAQAPTEVMVVDISAAKALSNLLQDSIWKNGPVEHIMYVATSQAPISNDPLSAQFTSLQNALALSQSVLSHHFETTPRLWLVTKNATWVDDKSELNLLSSPIWGFGSSLFMEHPELACKRVDIDSEKCGELLVKELAQNDVEDQVGFRNGERHVMRFLSAQPSRGDPYSCDPNAAYIVTGGFGGIGLKSVEMLIALGAQHIVVVSRNGKPSAGKAQETVEKWKAAGIDIEGQAVNMGDFEGLQAIIKNLKYPLKGILHSAGVAEDVSLIKSNWSKFESVFGPKVFGSWYLHLLTKDLNLDFFVFYSSVAATLGNPGQTNYAAANYFMDALARYRKGLDLPGVSINWGAWGEVGIAAERNLAASMKKKGVLSFPADVGIDALRALMVRSPRDSITVFWAAWETYFKQYTSVPPLFDNIAKKSRKANKSESTIISKLKQASNFNAALFEFVVQEIGSVIGLTPDQLDPDRELSDFGVDSLVATQLRNNFVNALAIPLPASMAFDYPTVKQMVEFLKPLVTKKIQAEASAETATKKDKPASTSATTPPKSLPSQVPKNTSTPKFSQSPNTDVDIAIVGMACRFPGGASLPEFWETLYQGKDAVRKATLYNYDGKTITTHGGFIDDIDKFDPKLFKIPYQQACFMDPQQRLALEVAWEALENAAIPPYGLENTRTGVYVGSFQSEYDDLIPDREAHLIDVVNGKLTGAIAGLIAHTFDLKGPTMTVDSACTGSLVAIHQACMSLKMRETDACIAGGVHTIINRWAFQYATAVGKAADRVRTFDASHDGYVRAEGCGLVVLKRLDDALANGDPIAAIIKASAVNHNGRMFKTGMQSAGSTVSLYEEALRAAQLSPSDISLYECASALPVFDILELEAVTQALCPSDRKTPLILGSAKTNVGYALPCAGVIGVIKTALTFQNEIVPRLLHLKTLNPSLPSLDGKIIIPSGTELIPLKGNHNAAVHGFGMTGTNAHLIMATAPVQEIDTNYNQSNSYIVPISALTATALRNNALRLNELLQKSPDLPSISYTYMVGRSHFEHRLSLVGSMAEIQKGLANYLGQHEQNSTARGKIGRQCFAYKDCPPAKLAFMFSAEEHSNHDQLVKLLLPSDSSLDEYAQQIVGGDPTFKEAFLECTALYQPAEIADFSEELALFALQYGLAKTWNEWGIEPSVCVGSGVGEYAAACVTGALSLQDAISILRARRSIILEDETLKSHAELIVYAKEPAVAALLQGSTAKIVSVNGLDTVVVAGEANVLRKLAFSLRVCDIRSQFIDRPRTQSLIHFLSDASLNKFRNLVANIDTSSPSVSLEPRRQADHFRQLSPEVTNVANLTQKLRPGTVVLEMNISATTSAFLQRVNRSSDNSITAIPTVGASKDMHHVLAQLYALGVSVNWKNYTNTSQKYRSAKRVVVPTYAFDNITCWFDDKPFRAFVSETDSVEHNSLVVAAEPKSPPQDPAPELHKLDLPIPMFEAEIHSQSNPKDNTQFASPASQIIGTILEALSQHDPDAFSAGALQLSDISWHPLGHVSSHYKANLQITPARDGTQFNAWIKSEHEKTWRLYASGFASHTSPAVLAENVEDIPTGVLNLTHSKSYIKSISTSEDRSNIHAGVSLGPCKSHYSFVQTLAHICADIVQITSGEKEPHLTKVVAISSLNLNLHSLPNLPEGDFTARIDVLSETTDNNVRKVTLNLVLLGKNHQLLASIHKVEVELL
eukprot:Phypoly_transcript_00105.p1 GENE.Phypoly_transcript_00105~~Phypoly_transcript_00105.p1  ORF type:complete len:2244 (+),score=346.95 Phypoly_transcript_00105:709-6732(+)